MCVILLHWPTKNTIVITWFGTTYYDNFYVYGKKIYIKMKWYLLLCDHFLYYNLPKILLPKGAILHFKLTWKLWHVFVMSSETRRRRLTNQNKQIFCQIFKSIWKEEITCFGNYFLKNGNIKCYSALNSGQLSITSFFLP